MNVGHLSGCGVQAGQGSKLQAAQGCHSVPQQSLMIYGMQFTALER